MSDWPLEGSKAPTFTLPADDGSKVKLVWTEIDKQKVKPGSVKGAYPLNPDGSFQVNKFVYRKVG